MSPDPALLLPEDFALLLVDLQAGLAFGVGSEDRQVLRNTILGFTQCCDTPPQTCLGPCMTAIGAKQSFA